MMHLLYEEQQEFQASLVRGDDLLGMWLAEDDFYIRQGNLVETAIFENNTVVYTKKKIWNFKWKIDH